MGKISSRLNIRHQVGNIRDSKFLELDCVIEREATSSLLTLTG
jgi:hypothetical protein